MTLNITEQRTDQPLFEISEDGQGAVLHCPACGSSRLVMDKPWVIAGNALRMRMTCGACGTRTTLAIQSPPYFIEDHSAWLGISIIEVHNSGTA